MALRLVLDPPPPPLAAPPCSLKIDMASPNPTLWDPIAYRWVVAWGGPLAGKSTGKRSTGIVGAAAFTTHQHHTPNGNSCPVLLQSSPWPPLPVHWHLIIMMQYQVLAAPPHWRRVVHLPELRLLPLHRRLAGAHRLLV